MGLWSLLFEDPSVGGKMVVAEEGNESHSVVGTVKWVADVTPALLIGAGAPSW